MSNNFNIKYLFPRTSKSKLLKSDDEGKYSISRPDDARYITKLIKKRITQLNHNYSLFKENNKNNEITITITDATAGVGGNSISFCKDFNSVNVIEIDKTRYDYLINNLNIYNLKNYNGYNGDMLKVIPNLNQDIIFIDPPWGGKNYVEHNDLDIYIDNTEISKISKDILDNNYCKLLVLKLPYNYNMNNLNLLKNSYIFTKNLIRNKILLLCIYSINKEK